MDPAVNCKKPEFTSEGRETAKMETDETIYEKFIPLPIVRDAFNINIHSTLKVEYSFRNRSCKQETEEIAPTCLLGSLGGTETNAVTTDVVSQKEMQFKCEICNLILSNKNFLIPHFSMHIGEKAFKCSVCLKQFDQLHFLKSHKSVHSEKNQLKCIHCGQTFKRSCALGGHQRIHLGNQTYGCHLCSAVFSAKKKLAKHEKEHSFCRTPTH